MVGVVIYELVYNQRQQHSPISLKVRYRAGLDAPFVNVYPHGITFFGDDSLICTYLLIRPVSRT